MQTPAASPVIILPNAPESLFLRNRKLKYIAQPRKNPANVNFVQSTMPADRPTRKNCIQRMLRDSSTDASPRYSAYANSGRHSSSGPPPVENDFAVYTASAAAGITAGVRFRAYRPHVR